MSGNVTQVVDGGIADVLLVAACGGDGVGLYAVDTTAAPSSFAATSDYRRHD